MVNVIVTTEMGCKTHCPQQYECEGKHSYKIYRVENMAKTPQMGW